MNMRKIFFLLPIATILIRFSCKKESRPVAPDNSLQKEFGDTTSLPGSGGSGLTIEVEGFTVTDSDSVKIQNVGIGQ